MPNTETSEQWSADELRKVSLEVTKVVAGFLREYRERNPTMELVKEETFKADVMAESLAIEELENNDIKGLIVTEERGVLQRGNDDIISILDPLDGTINYVSGVPWCAVSLAFAVRTSNPSLDDVIAGTVWPVFYGKPISFARNHGIYYGDERVTRDYIYRNYASVGRKILAVYEDDPKAIDSIKRVYSALASHLKESGYGVSLKIRSFGSAALELAYIALGRIGYFVDLRARLRIVDVAAGLGAIREAGGYFSDSQGNPVKLRTDRISRLESIVAGANGNDIQIVLNALRSGL